VYFKERQGDDSDEWMQKVYWSAPHFVKMQQEHPRVVASLRKKMKKVGETTAPDALRPLERDLYDAYRIMHEYVEDDNVLFR
jgi:type VI protein secretion system component VasA